MNSNQNLCMISTEIIAVVHDTPFFDLFAENKFNEYQSIL